MRAHFKYFLNFSNKISLLIDVINYMTFNICTQLLNMGKDISFIALVTSEQMCTTRRFFFIVIVIVGDIKLPAKLSFL